MSPTHARTISDRRLERRDRRSPSPRWQFLRGFIKHPKMVGSIIPSSRILINKMLEPVDWANPGVRNMVRVSAPSLARSSTSSAPTRIW